MGDLDLHQLRTFVAVSRHGSVARAAGSLRLTASPVSRTLRDLESTTGPLFDRGYHDMRLTEQGHRLLPLAVGVVLQAHDLALVARGEQLALRWSATPWVPDRFAEALRRAVSAAGTAEEIDGAVSSALLHRMVHGEVDVAVVHLPVSAPGLGSVPLTRYRLGLAVPAEDPLADRAAVRGADLHGRRVLVLPMSMQPKAMARLRDWAIEAGAESVEEIALADVPMLASRLRREHAVTFGMTDTRVFPANGPAVRIVPFDDEPVDFVLGLAWRNDDPVRRRRLEAVVESMKADQEIADAI